MSARLECLEIDTKSVHTQKRMELKLKELESRVELEQTSKSRLEVSLSSLNKQTAFFFVYYKCQPLLTFTNRLTRFFVCYLDSSVTTQRDVG